MNLQFIYGGDTGETPESLRRKRAVAEALAQQGLSQTPRNVGESIAAVGNALAFRLMMDKLEGAERVGQSSWQPDWAPVEDWFSKSPEETASGGGDYASAISGIESGGKYDALGPVTKTGDRAYGKYQVMGANIPGWSQEALGRQLTAEQFLADPQAQDAVFQHRFGSYANKYGPEGAARAWFAGEGGMNDLARTDQLGTSVAEYAKRFTSQIDPTA
jgi:hypothetical protein